MAHDTTEYFDSIIESAKQLWEEIDYQIDITPKRQIFKLTANYQQHRLFITELWSEDQRKYRYYLLLGDEVQAGFDNASDPRAIRIKYGDLRNHLGELVPHLHLENKTKLELTEEMYFSDFLEWLSNYKFELS